MVRYLVYVAEHPHHGGGILIVRYRKERVTELVLLDNGEVIVGDAHEVKEELRKRGYRLKLIYDSHGEEGG